MSDVLDNTDPVVSDPVVSDQVVSDPVVSDPSVHIVADPFSYMIATPTAEPTPTLEPVIVLTPAEISAQKCTYINNIQIVPTILNENELHIEPIVFENYVAMEQLSNDNIDGIVYKYSVYGNPAMNLLSRPFHTTEQMYEDVGLTERTKSILQQYLNSLLEKKEKINILELGVADNGNTNSTTQILISNKRPQDVYCGIDIIQKNAWNGENVNIIHSPSEYIDINIDRLNRLYAQKVEPLRSMEEPFQIVPSIVVEESNVVNEIDMLVIDGWHSMEQLYKEWQYTRILSSVGVVFINSVNLYPGPYYITKSIDDTKYDIYRYLSDVKDNGICVAVRK